MQVKGKILVQTYSDWCFRAPKKYFKNLNFCFPPTNLVDVPRSLFRKTTRLVFNIQNSRNDD